MLNPLKIAIFTCAAFFFINDLHAAMPNYDHPTTFLGPSLSLQVLTPLTNNTAVSVLGEGGLRNVRANATLGWQINANQQLKLTGEYLIQKLTYSFVSGDADAWMQQGALGLSYKYLFEDSVFINYYFLMNGYASYAPNKHLGNQPADFIHNGVMDSIIDVRDIAGSHAEGVSPGIGMSPWWGTTAELLLNYDNVQYNKSNPPSASASGLGGTFTLTQQLIDRLSLGAQASVRKPFNYYGGNINWNGPRNWSFGVCGGYTAGKFGMPNSYDVGLDAVVSLDRKCKQEMSGKPGNYKGEFNYKGELALPTFVISAEAVDPMLAAWTNNPAVYMPQVIAVRDEKINTIMSGQCMQGPPVLLSTPVIGLIHSYAYSSPTFSISSSFANTQNSTYKVNFTLLSTSDPTQFSIVANNAFIINNNGTITYDINQITGTPLFGTVASYTLTVTLTGPGNCGSVTTTFPVEVAFDQ